MELLTPGSGLLFWQIVVFVSLLLLLKTFAWQPILHSLKIREESIQEALDSAKEAKEEMSQLKAENEKLLQEARIERDKILKVANTVASKIKDEAKSAASGITDKMIEVARKEIESEKNAALQEVRNLVVSLSVEIAERLLQKALAKDVAQKELVDQYLKEKNLN